MESLERLMQCGDNMGLTGEELRTFVTEQQAMEREERQRKREIEKEKAEAEKEKAEAEKEKAEAEKEKARITAEIEKEKLRLEEAKEVRASEMFINEAAERQKERDHELKILQMRSTRSREHLGSDSDNDDKFEWSKVSKLLPKFNEKDLTKFFLHFEKLMHQCECPEKYWTLLLQSVLTGKAQVAYSSMDVEVSKNYETVKDEILKLYQLVPEAYRLKFRNFRKESSVTYVEFARSKRLKFREWCESQKVGTLEKLEELILLEDFKNNLPHNLRMYVEELQIDKLGKAAEVSDEYTLIHKVSGKASSSEQHPKKNSSKQDGNGNLQDQKKRQCFRCGSSDHLRYQCPNKNKPKQTLLMEKVTQNKEVENESLKPFRDYISNSYVSVEGKDVSLVTLRDTGAAVTVIKRSSLPSDFIIEAKEYEIIRGFPDNYVSCPVLELDLETEWGKGNFKVAVADTLPIEGVELILGNDAVKGETPEFPVVKVVPGQEENIAVITRSGTETLSEDFNLEGLENVKVTHNNKTPVKLDKLFDLSREKLIKEQRSDKGLLKVFESAQEYQSEMDFSEATFVINNDVLFRCSRHFSESAEPFNVKWQIMVPDSLKNAVISLAHEGLMSSHMGFYKTFCKINSLFYWTAMRKDIKRFIRSCHVCQVVKRPNERIPKAPLINIPSVGEPFQEVVVDAVGPLPRTKRGYQYILSVIDRATRYPEAIPLRNIKADTVVDALLNYFSKFGLPTVIQTDQGTNFKSRIFESKFEQLGVKHVTSTAYHPESQGIVERFHQTLKNGLRKLCFNNEKSWDEKLPFVLFSIRAAPSKSLGLSPFQLVFAHNVQGPMDLLWRGWTKGNVPDLTNKVVKAKDGLQSAWELTRSNLETYQSKVKRTYDKKAKRRIFSVGDKVLALLPVDGMFLQRRFSGPYVIIDKRGPVNYQIRDLKGTVKPRWLHVNLIKSYNEPSDSDGVNVNLSLATDISDAYSKIPSLNIENSTIISNFKDHVIHLSKDQYHELVNLLHSYPEITRDEPGLTDLLEHDVELTDEKPIRQHPYRLNLRRSLVLKRK